MKRLLIALALVLPVHLLNAQYPAVSVPPPAAANLSVGNVGLAGYNTYYYMVIANYPSGAVQSPIFVFQNGNATLNSTNYNQLGWQALPGVLNFDILRLPSNSFTGTCTCALATAQSSSTLAYSDQGGGLSMYTVAAPAVGATQQFYLDNTDYAFAKLRTIVTAGGVQANHLAEIISGAALPVYCQPGDITIVTGTGGITGGYACLVANTWTPFGSTSGGALLVPFTAGTGGVTANQPVKLSGATVVKTLTTDTTPVTAFGIAQSTVTAGGTVMVAIAGQVSCIADTGGITAGNLVLAGTTVADTCKDSGQTVTQTIGFNTAVLGRALTTATATNPALVLWYPQFGAGNLPYASLIDCAATAACPSTVQSNVQKIVMGRGTLVSASPSTYAVTAMSPAFTSATTYNCYAQDTTTIANNIGVLTAGYVSGSAVTFTGPNTNTDTFRFVCIGY